jgi:hypothetical protein
MNQSSHETVALGSDFVCQRNVNATILVRMEGDVGLPSYYMYIIAMQIVGRIRRLIIVRTKLNP